MPLALQAPRARPPWAARRPPARPNIQGQSRAGRSREGHAPRCGARRLPPRLARGFLVPLLIHSRAEGRKRERRLTRDDAPRGPFRAHFGPTFGTKVALGPSPSPREARAPSPRDEPLVVFTKGWACSHPINCADLALWRQIVL